MKPNKAKLKTAKELSEEHKISVVMVHKKMNRHGYKMDSKNRYKESEFLAAQKAGAQADKAQAAKQLADLDAEGKGETLQSRLLRRKIDLLDIDIETAKAKLDDLVGRSVPIETYKQQLAAVQGLMLCWWDRAAENAATKVKDASILAALREARDRASREILEIT
jgi:hypothetical protein